jgi:hypothetical protein
VTTTSQPLSGLPSSPDLKGRIVDFMERADELLRHPMANYKAPMAIKEIVDESTGEVLSRELDHCLVDKEVLVYFATMERPMLFTKDPIYVPKLIEAIRQEHPAHTPNCTMMTKQFKDDWRNRIFLGVKASTTPAPNSVVDWTLTDVWAAPTGTPFPQDELSDVAMVGDREFADLYLNGFLWHSDSNKTAAYRQASELMQLHYRKCAEIRVFAGLQIVIKSIHEFFSAARAAGEDF